MSGLLELNQEWRMFRHLHKMESSLETRLQILDQVRTVIEDIFVWR